MGHISLGSSLCPLSFVRPCVYVCVYAIPGVRGAKCVHLHVTGAHSSRNYIINNAARVRGVVGKRQEIASGSTESMATGPSPSTASTEVNLAQQAIQLLRQSQGQSGTDRKTIEKVVFNLRVKELKEVCREFKVKANKAALCGRIISYWQTGLFHENKLCSPSYSADSPLSVITPSIRQSLKKLGKLSCVNGDWKRDLSLLEDFTFMDLFTYLVESKDNTFDQGSMRTFKSLKAFRYFADGYVQNVWATEAVA